MPHPALFNPPTIPTLCQCLHCGQEFESYLIYPAVESDAHGQQMDVWCCPTDDCDGRGFGLDIFPVDPDYISEDGVRMNGDVDEAESCEDDELEAAWDDDDDDLLGPSIETFGDEAPARDWTSDDPLGEDDIPW